LCRKSWSCCQSFMALYVYGFGSTFSSQGAPGRLQEMREVHRNILCICVCVCAACALGREAQLLLGGGCHLQDAREHHVLQSLNLCKVSRTCLATVQLHPNANRDPNLPNGTQSSPVCQSRSNDDLKALELESLSSVMYDACKCRSRYHTRILM
jgi:hypothetical protein